MTQRDRLALVFGATMAAGMLATGAAVAAEDTSASDGVSQAIGVSATSYKYTEDDLMSLKGTKLGIDYNLRFDIGQGWFVRGDARYARGKLDYESNGTGTSKNNTNWYLEPRLVAGYDFAFGNHTLGPYTGLGFRYLYHDGRGTTSTGHLGYRRESRYFYLPLGLTHRWSLGERTALTTTIEYDYLIEGRQTSEMGDVFVGETTPAGTTLTSVDAAKNDQKTGHGWRGSVMMQMGNWTFGPYASYWRISNSEIDYVHAEDNVGTRWVFTAPLYEPKNKTTEAGVKVFYVF